MGLLKTTVSACCLCLQPEFVSDFYGFLTITSEVQTTVQLAQRAGGENLTTLGKKTFMNSNSYGEDFSIENLADMVKNMQATKQHPDDDNNEPEDGSDSRS